MKAVLLNERPDIVARVYGERQMARLKSLVDLREGVVTSEALRQGGFEETEAVFTTWGMPGLTGEEIKTLLPRLKAVFHAAGSVQAFARPFLDRGVRVFSAWQANAVPVAEFTFAQIILAMKGYFQAQAAARTSRKDAIAILSHYPGNFDVKVGLLGCGAVGSGVARRLNSLSCRTLVFDPFLSGERAAALNVTKASLDEIFAECDVISNHLANLPATVGIIKRSHFMSMKPYATFINTGRGPQLDEKDLFDCLVECPSRTALIDVMTDERNSDEKPLNRLPNCFITPHMAGSSGNEVRRMAEYMMDAYVLMEKGESCDYEVSLKMLETMA